MPTVLNRRASKDEELGYTVLTSVSDPLLSEFKQDCRGSIDVDEAPVQLLLQYQLSFSPGYVDVLLIRPEHSDPVQYAFHIYHLAERTGDMRPPQGIPTKLAAMRVN